MDADLLVTGLQLIRSCKVLGKHCHYAHAKVCIGSWTLTFEVCSNIDDLFELPAPAAMGRGPWSGYTHGDRMNGAVLRSQVILERVV